MLYTVCFCEHQSGLFVFISRFRRRRTCPKANEAESATRNRCRVAHIFIYFLLYFFALAARTRSHLAAALVGAALARIDRRGRVCALSLSLCTFSSLSLSPCPSSVHHHRDQNTERCLALVCVCVCVGLQIDGVPQVAGRFRRLRMEKKKNPTVVEVVRAVEHVSVDGPDRSSNIDGLARK